MKREAYSLDGIENLIKEITGMLESLPDYPGSLEDWIAVVIQKIEGHGFQAILPQWRPVYLDPAHQKMVKAARQTGKSSYASIKMTFVATTRPGSAVVYVTYDETNLSHYSNQKYRRGFLAINPAIRILIKGNGIGQRGMVAFKNTSAVFLVTDEGEYKHVEGKSPYYVLHDETQYGEIQFLPVIREAMSFTQGYLDLVGRGGEEGSEYSKVWDQTSQMEFVFDDTTTYKDSAGKLFPGHGWRKNLKFGKRTDGSYGLLQGDYLQKACAGKYVMRKPQNYMFPGYWLPQEIFPHIPLTIADAINLYRIPAEFSIEWKKKNYPKMIYLAHVEARDYKGARRPITEAMVKACMEPYRDYSFLTPDDIMELRGIYPGRVTVFMGVDWGSSMVGTSATVVSILVKILTGTTEDTARYYLAFIHKVQRGEPGEPEVGADEANWIVDLFNKYHCDYGVADLGFGEIPVKYIQEGGINPRNNQRFEGLHISKFIGCRTIQDITAPEQDITGEVDDEKEEFTRLQVDKTHIIDNFINFLQWKVNYVARGDQTIRDGAARPKLIIPFSDENAVLWLTEWTKITRKDIEKTIDIAKEDPRQAPSKKYNHPPDSAMSIIYCLIADNNFRPGGADFGGIAFRSSRR